MKVLFVSRHHGYFRNYDSVLRELSARGHRVHLAIEKHESLGAEEVVDALVRECPGVTSAMVPEGRVDIWSTVSRFLRLGLDYLRYLDPFYDSAPLRRIRAYNRTPRWLTALANPPLLRGPRWRRAVGRLLHGVDSAVPPPAAILEYLRDESPDAVLIMPFVELGSPQVDYLRAAHMLGIPVALPIWSWDHLTCKALIRDHPERVFVWNETQRQEAIELHGIPGNRILVTGAQCFDHWFERRPSRTREEFCESLGLAPGRPILLYVCSAVIEGSAPEHEFVQEWLEWVRGSDDPVVASANVLIRPYPTKLTVWHDVDLSAYGPVAVSGGNPFDERSRSDYFDSLYHSAAVVGLNTSVFLEAGILGREVLTILVPRYYDSQEGSAHFRYLLQIGGGLLRVGRDRESHLRQTAEALRRQRTEEHPHRAFLETFIRPHGLDRRATPQLVTAIEELAACEVEVPEQDGNNNRRAAFERVVWMASRLFRSETEWSRKIARIEHGRRFRAEKEQATAERRAERERAKAARLAEEQRVRDARLHEKQQLRQARVREKERKRETESRQKAALKRRARLKQMIKEKLW